MMNQINGHFADFAPAGAEMVGFGVSYRQLEQLKREIDVAVWNWETRRGLPHYGEDWRQTNNAHFMEYQAKKLAATNGHKATA